MPDVDMKDEYAHSSLAPPSTPGAAYAPAFASATPLSARADPTLQAFRSRQHADPGMSSSPAQPARYHREARVSEEGTLGLFCLLQSQQTTLVLSLALRTSPQGNKSGTGPRVAESAETLKFLRGRSADACQQVQSKDHSRAAISRKQGSSWAAICSRMSSRSRSGS